MGYVPGFPIDVFISYAHRNNADGWISGLDEYLSKRLPQLVEHDEEIVIWRDRRLDGFAVIWPTLREKIQSSALFLSVCSPVYVTSESCETEVECFLNEGADTPRVERRSRMARLVIIPYSDVRDLRPCFQRDDTVRYTFFAERPDGTFEQYEIDSPRFKSEADRMAQHIAGQLRRLREVHEKSVERTAPRTRKKLFIANSSKDRAADRTTVINEFKGHELLEIPDGAYSLQELTARTQQLLEHATCSIHILGERPGITLDDSDESIVHVQYRLALAHRPQGFSQVVWAPATMQLGPGLQKEFVEKIRTFSRDLWNESTEVIGGGLDDLLRGVKGILDREVRRIEPPGPLYLLCTKADMDQGDADLAKLRDCLCLSGILPEFPAFDDQDVDLAELEKNIIARSCATVIYYARGGDGWVKLKRLNLLRVLGELKASGRHVRAVYVGAPPNVAKDAQYLGVKIPELPEAKGFPPLLILGSAGAFEPDHLKPLLERLGGGRP